MGTQLLCQVQVTPAGLIQLCVTQPAACIRWTPAEVEELIVLLRKALDHAATMPAESP